MTPSFPTRRSSDLAYDVPSKRTRKLTEGLPPFWDTYRERNVRNGMDYYTVKLAGWSKVGHYVIMSDHFDLWALPRRPDDAAQPIRPPLDRRATRISHPRLPLHGTLPRFPPPLRPLPEHPPRRSPPPTPLPHHALPSPHPPH